MSKRGREEDVEQQPNAKKAKQALLDLAFDGHRDDLPHLPRELRSLIVDLTAPSPLRLLADNPAIPLLRPDGGMSPLFDCAMEQVFRSLATHPNASAPFGVTMSRSDFTVLSAIDTVAEGVPAIPSDKLDVRWMEVMKNFGLPDRVKRHQLSFDGFCENMLGFVRKPTVNFHNVIKKWADHFEPVHPRSV